MKGKTGICHLIGWPVEGSLEAAGDPRSQLVSKQPREGAGGPTPTSSYFRHRPGQMPTSAHPQPHSHPCGLMYFQIQNSLIFKKQ